MGFRSASLRVNFCAVISVWQMACDTNNPDDDPPAEETLAEHVARCESFTGDSVVDCPEDCMLIESVHILYDGVTCEMETDGDGVPIKNDLCVVADLDDIGFGNRGTYRRVAVGDTAADPVTPVEPEEVLRLLIVDGLQGWERCTESTSDYCECALQFEDLDG